MRADMTLSFGLSDALRCSEFGRVYAGPRVHHIEGGLGCLAADRASAAAGDACRRLSFNRYASERCRTVFDSVSAGTEHAWLRRRAECRPRKSRGRI